MSTLGNPFAGMTDAFGNEIPENSPATAVYRTADPEDLEDDVTQLLELLRDTNPSPRQVA